MNISLFSDRATKYNLDKVLLKFSDAPSDHWLLRDAVRGTQVFGSLGSGKSSGSGKTIAQAFLRNGFGGLVLCAKPDEAMEWQKYAQACGRLDDMIIFKESSPWRFNPLQYETSREGRGAGLTYNLTELFMSVFKMGQRLSGSNAEEKERFWDNSLRRAVNRIIDLLKIAREELSIQNMVEILSLSPHGEKINRFNSIKDDSELIKWAEKDFFFQCLLEADQNANTEQAKRDFGLVKNFFLRDFANLDERVRSTIQEMFLGFCEPFLSGILNDHFAKDTNLLPEVTFQGKIIVLDFSVKEYLVSGIYAQCLYKYLWQQAVERRKVTDTTPPVFLWQDESQYFVNEYDTIFQTTARSSRACTVLLTQNISNYYAQMGGKDAEPKVDSLLGNLATKIFHGNNDSVTNDWASKVISQNFIALEGGSFQSSAFSATTSQGQSYMMHLMPQVLPLEFTTLKSGGEENDCEVQGIITLSGRRWSNGKNYRKVIFKQNQ
jgi:hypothetical protein